MLAVARRTIAKAFEEAGREIDNIRLVSVNIEAISEALDENDRADRIYINFCNPWPRKKHKKHHHRKKNSSDATTDNSINKEVKRKGVSFKKNLFEVIYVESFKQYNMENYQPKNVDNSVARDDPHFVKCCLIY